MKGGVFSQQFDSTSDLKFSEKVYYAQSNNGLLTFDVSNRQGGGEVSYFQLCSDKGGGGGVVNFCIFLTRGG